MVTFDKDEPAHQQNTTFDCSQDSLEWALYALGRAPDDAWMTSSMMAAGVLSSELGLMDATGAGLAEWIGDNYGTDGFYGNHEPSVTFTDVALEIGPYPLLIGGRSWGAGGHWSGVRGYDAAQGRLQLANPAEGYDNIGQTMSEREWDERGPWSMVRVLHPDLLGEQPPSPEVPVPGPTPPPISATYPEGIDVSNNQGWIDWGQVGSAGLGFAFIKLSEGTWFRDGHAARNWSEAKRIGLARGLYHFARPSQCSGSAEASYFLDSLSAVGCVLEPGDMVALDLEDPTVAGAAELADYTLDWLQQVASRLGFLPLVYTTPSYAEAHKLWRRPEIAQCGLWLASWGVPTPPAAVAPWGLVAFHQYQVGAAGSVPGIAGEIDQNRFNGSLEAIGLYGMPGQVTPPEPGPDPEPTPPPDGGFLVGSGLMQAMTDRGDAPASSEYFPNPDWSEVMGMSGAMYRWNKKLGQALIYPAG